MEIILLIAVVVIAVLAYRSYRRTQLQTKKRDEISSAELESVKRTADEDITKFGEELQDLDLDMVGKDLGDGARQDYQRALDSYEAAKEAVGKVTEAEQIKHVIEILEDGRYAMACVRARVNDEPLPQRRPSCFFNPQHGPSVVDVMWSPRAVRPAKYRPVPLTPSASAPAPNRTSAKSWSARSASRTGRPARPTPLTHKACSAPSAA